MIRLAFILLLSAAPLAAQTVDLGAGITHYNARRWTEAHAFFAATVKGQPRSADAALWYGKTLLAENRPADAEDWFEKAAKLEPRRSEHLLWQARAIGMQAQRASVLKQPFLARRMKSTVDRAIEIDPDNIDARELRWQFYSMAPSVMGGGADHARAEAAEIVRRNRYRGELIAAAAAVRSKDNAAAERTLKTLAGAYPDSLAPLSAYANLLIAQQRAAEAFALMDGYQRRRPADPVVLYQIGRLAAATGQQLDRGEGALRTYLTLLPPPTLTVPSAANAHVRLGNIAERRGNAAAARAEYEQALKLEPRNGQAQRALAALK